MSIRLTTILAANALALVGLLYTVGVIPPAVGRTTEPLLLIAHRGDMANHPENTVEGFVAAAALGADGIEMDVWRSRSGTWWVMHDPTVDRTTDGRGLIPEMTDEQIASLTIDAEASGHTIGGATRVPRLDEALGALEEYRGLLYVHLKDPSPENGRQLGTLLAHSGRVASTTVIVPSEDAARHVQGAHDDLRTIVLRDGLGMPDDTEFVDGWLTTESRVIRADIVAWRPYPVEVYADGRAALRDESESITRAYRFNVRAYITNDLAAAQATLAKLEAGR